MSPSANLIRTSATLRALVSLVDSFSVCQAADGAVTGDLSRAKAALDQIIDHMEVLCRYLECPDTGRAFAHDARAWCSQGFGPAPSFDATLLAFTTNAQRDPKYLAFLGPCIAPNGPRPKGWFLEF